MRLLMPQTSPRGRKPLPPTSPLYLAILVSLFGITMLALISGKGLLPGWLDLPLCNPGRKHLKGLELELAAGGGAGAGGVGGAGRARSLLVLPYGQDSGSSNGSAIQGSGGGDSGSDATVGGSQASGDLLHQIELLRGEVERFRATNKKLLRQKRHAARQRDRALKELEQYRGNQSTAQEPAKAAAQQADGYGPTGNATLDAGAVRALLSECEAGLNATEKQLKSAETVMRSYKLQLSSARDNMANVKVDIQVANAELRDAKAQLEAQGKELTTARAELASAKDALVRSGVNVSELAVAAAPVADCANGTGSAGETPSWLDYPCEATAEDMAQYLGYEAQQACPDDWLFVQELIFRKRCYALPRRRCRALTPPNPTEPLGLPQALFSPEALSNSNVRWEGHGCKSYDCLRARTKGACPGCFDLAAEEGRWQAAAAAEGAQNDTVTMSQVVAEKKGALRVGLDVDGGTGSFAAHMAKLGVTIVTTASDQDSTGGEAGGVPFSEAIAARGLLPLHIPKESRLPFFDGVLDIVHSSASIKYLPLLQFEELLYEWDRVLRAGGLLWLENLSAPTDEMPKYVALLDQLAYRRVHWGEAVRNVQGLVPRDYTTLNCVLEKQPVRASPPSNSTAALASAAEGTQETPQESQE